MKCICKKCEDCRLYISWDMENSEGLRKQFQACAILVVAQEVPRIRSAIDGLQGGVNEARNRSMETKDAVETRIRQFVDTLKFLGGEINGRSEGGNAGRNQIGEG
jgi:hypothetical protein